MNLRSHGNLLICCHHSDIHPCPFCLYCLNFLHTITKDCRYHSKNIGPFRIVSPSPQGSPTHFSFLSRDEFSCPCKVLHWLNTICVFWAMKLSPNLEFCDHLSYSTNTATYICHKPCHIHIPQTLPHTYITNTAAYKHLCVYGNVWLYRSSLGWFCHTKLIFFQFSLENCSY